MKDAFDLKKTIQEVFPFVLLGFGFLVFLNYGHLILSSWCIHLHYVEFFQATHLAEAVGAGMGGSFQGFVKRVFQR